MGKYKNRGIYYRANKLEGFLISYIFKNFMLLNVKKYKAKKYKRKSETIPEKRL